CVAKPLLRTLHLCWLSLLVMVSADAEGNMARGRWRESCAGGQKGSEPAGATSQGRLSKLSFLGCSPSSPEADTLNFWDPRNVGFREASSAGDSSTPRMLFPRTQSLSSRCLDSTRAECS
ncbi:RIKEN cDNA A430093F15, isoform CRA_b, partial [Mus musculus]